MIQLPSNPIAISDISYRINKLVKTGVVSLQFEDIARQLIEHIEKRVQHLDSYMENLLGGYLDVCNASEEEGAKKPTDAQTGRPSETRARRLSGIG